MATSNLIDLEPIILDFARCITERLSDAERSLLAELYEQAARRSDSPEILRRAHQRGLSLRATVELLRQPRLVAIEGGAS